MCGHPCYVVRLPAVVKNIRRLEATSNRTHRELARQSNKSADATQSALRQLGHKADVAGLASLANDVATLREGKAESATLAMLADEVAKLAERKAEAATLTAFASELAALAERKADAAVLAALANEVLRCASTRRRQPAGRARERARHASGAQGGTQLRSLRWRTRSPRYASTRRKGDAHGARERAATLAARKADAAALASLAKEIATLRDT